MTTLSQTTSDPSTTTTVAPSSVPSTTVAVTTTTVTTSTTVAGPLRPPQVQDFEFISTGSNYATLVAQVDPGGTYTVVELTCTPTRGGTPRVITNAKGGSGWQTEVLGCDNLLEGREYTAQMRIYNSSGEVVTPVLTFTTDPAIGFTIDEGAAFTRSGTVTLTFVPGDAVDALVSNDGSFANATLTDPREPLTWSLSSPDVSGTRVVYVKLIRANGDRIGTFTDDIVLDRNAPTVSAWTATVGTAARLTIDATDDLSGLGTLEVAGPSGSTSLTFGDGNHDIPLGLLTAPGGDRSGRFRVKDTVGNASAWTDFSAAIAPQTTPPTDDDASDDSTVAPETINLPDDDELAQLPQIPPSTALGRDTAEPLVPGEQVAVTFPAGTFTPFEWVSISIHSEPVHVLTAQAGTDGSLSASLAVPGTVGSGNHTLAAVGQTSRRGATVAIQIAAPRSFVALTPSRLLDTRDDDKVGRLDGSGAALTLDVAGRAGLPSTGIGAVALNVTVVDSEANDFGGYVTVYPCGTKPNSSNLNFVSGQTVANSVIAPVSAAGQVCFYVYGKAHILADVSGYFPTGFTAMTPQRLLDTRPTGRRVGELNGTGRELELQVSGTAGVPTDGVNAVALNVTVVDGQANDFGGYVTVYPCGTRPDSSNLNFVSGQTVPNSVIAPLSSTGSICLYVYGSAHLLADVSGYFTDGFEPLTPARLLDTRQTGTRIGKIDGSGTAHVLQVGGKGVPSSAIAVALNVTVADTTANDFGGFVTVYPCGTRPDSSNLNFQSGQTVPNSVIAPLSPDGTLCIYVYGSAHALVDVSGHL